jgi:hypothetical protein
MNKRHKEIMKEILEDVRLYIPKSEVQFLKELAHKMGWTIETKESSLRKYIDSRPKGADLSDEDILLEVNSVRYKR